MISVLMIIVVMVVLNQTKGKSFTNSGHYYIPNEKRLIPYSKYFCQSLKVKTKYSGILDYSISLNLLDSDPYLFDHNIMYIRSMKHLSKKRVYYIHFGSNVTINACNRENSYCSIYINKKFNNGSTSVVKSFSLYSCGDDLSPYSYFFDDEGYYFFSTDTFDTIPCDLFVNITLFLASYSLYDSTSISSCSIYSFDYGSTCSIDLPFSTTRYALLSIKPYWPSTNIGKFDEVPLETICEPRVWVYLLSSVLLTLVASCYFHLCCIITVFPLKTFRCCVSMMPSWCILTLSSIIIGVCYPGLSHYNHLSYKYNFLPNNTQLVPFSNVYCKNLIITCGCYDYCTVSLYQLSAKPNTYFQQPLHISEEIVTEVRHYYLFYLNNNSKIFIKACFVDDYAITPNTYVYIAKGINGYNGGHRQSDIKVLPEFEIYYNCTSSNSSYHQFSVTEDNFYYIIFFTNTRGYNPQLYLRVIMTLYLTQYSLENNTITSSCSASTIGNEANCFEGVSLLHTDHILLSIESNSFDEISLESIPIEIQCVSRQWIIPCSIIFLSLLVVPITCCCCLCIKIIVPRDNCPSLHYSYIKMATPDQTDAITAKFKRAWTKGRVREVTAVFVVHNGWHQFVCWFRSGREEYYHGTKLCCNIKRTRKLCRNESCGICGIARRGFDKNKIRSDSFQRYGPGFYLAPNSSKANDYAKGSYTAMLLCDVYPGRKYKLSQNNTNINGPPRRFQTIYGTVGGVLNYEEIVVQPSRSNDIHPRYIIVYK